MNITKSKNKNFNTVYHYCSLDTFFSIINNKSLRLSDITKSNDSMEIMWITNYIKDVFDEEFNKEIETTRILKDNYPKSIFMELIDHYLKDFFEENHRLYSYFVCCFTEKRDLLSQWRGYADDGMGVAIGFDIDLLSSTDNLPENDYISSPILKFGQVEYQERFQKSEIRKIAKDLISELKIISRKGINEIKKDSMVAYNNCFLKLFNLSIFMKNPFFKEEKEWRICYCGDINPKIQTSHILLSNNFHMSDIEYYNRNKDIVPYIDLKFNTIPQLIKEVVIGPKCNARKNDIKMYLELNGINCSVDKSEGTYR